MRTLPALLMANCMLLTAVWGQDATAPPAKIQGPRRLDPDGDPLPDGALARLGSKRFRYGSWNGLLAFTSDPRVLLGQCGGELIWLDVTTGKQVRKLELEDERVSFLAVSADCRRAIGYTTQPSPDGMDALIDLFVLDLDTGDKLSSKQWRRGQAAVPTAAAFHPGGRLAAIGLSDGGIDIIEIATGNRAYDAILEGRKVSDVTFSPDGSRLIACSVRGAFVWDYESGPEPRQLPELDRGALSAIYAPDGSWLATASDDRRTKVGVRVWNPGKLEVQLRLKHSVDRMIYARQMGATADRLVVPVNQPRGGVEIWDPSSGKLLQFLDAEGQQLQAAVISADGRFVAAREFTGALLAWDLTTGKRLDSDVPGHAANLQKLCWTPDGRSVVTAGNGLVAVWDADTGELRREFRHDAGQMIRGLDVSPDGRWLASSSNDDTTRIWDLETGEQKFSLPGHGRLGGQGAVRFSPEGKRLIDFGDNDWLLRVFDTSTGKAVCEHPIVLGGMRRGEDGLPVNQGLDLPLGARAFIAPDGQTLVLVSPQEGTVIDVASGRERMRFNVSDDHAAISPDSKRIALVSHVDGSPDQRRVRIHDLSTGDPVEPLDLILGWGTRCEFSPDGRSLLVLSDSIEIYDVTSGRLMARLTPKPAPAFLAAFSPDGEKLAVAHHDMTVLIWDWKQSLVPLWKKFLEASQPEPSR